MERTLRFDFLKVNMPSLEQPEGQVQAHIARLFVYPVKSCAGVELPEALLTETGFDLDRAWMVVDRVGNFVTQREFPRMALVRPQIKTFEVVLRAPGMLALHLGIDQVDSPANVRIWNDELAAWDMGDVAGQWFSDFLGQEGLRLVRFDPEVQRLASRKWTGDVEAPVAFADGFPLLLASEASLEGLNTRLQAAGHPTVAIERFRPNIVLAGIEDQDEDRMSEVVIGTADGSVRLRPVKPCTRCPIPDIDPETAEESTYVMDTLQGYRSNPGMKGAVTFAMNAVMLDGIGCVVRVGDSVSGDFRFDDLPTA